MRCIDQARVTLNFVQGSADNERVRISVNSFDGGLAAGQWFVLLFVLE